MATSGRLLLLWGLGLVLLVGVWCSGCMAKIPIPPRQNEAQAYVWNRANEMAGPASAAAVPKLLAIFDSDEFRSEVADLPIANSTSQDILTLLQNIFLEATQFHNFPVFPSPYALDVSLDQMIATGFLPNYYTASLEGYLPYSPLLVTLENYAETFLFKYPAFANFSQPTVEEALTRPQYSCLNFYGATGGCFLFGDISFGFYKPWVQNMTVLSPFDTGYYTGCCLLNTTLNATNPNDHHHTHSKLHQFMANNNNNNNNSSSNSTLQTCQGPVGKVNCNAWNGTLGTLTDFNHLILANSEFWNIPLSIIFNRYFNPDAQLSILGDYGSFIGYVEGTVAGSIPFPEGVAHLEVGVAQMMGTNQTSIVRSWALNNSWPILWSSGLAVPRTLNDSSPYFFLNINDAIIDPFLVQFTNISISPGNLTLAQELFTETQDLCQYYLQSDPDGIHDSLYWSKVYKLLLEQIDPALHVRLPGILNECIDDTGRCFAVQYDTHQCVCLV